MFGITGQKSKAEKGFWRNSRCSCHLPTGLAEEEMMLLAWSHSSDAAVICRYLQQSILHSVYSLSVGVYVCLSVTGLMSVQMN